MIRTFDELSDKLSNELAWRRKELTDLRHFIRASTSFPIKRRVLGRCGITMLYAHWEGFVKNASRSYLEYLTAQRLRNNELNKNLLTLSMARSTSVPWESNKISPFKKITEFYFEGLTKRSRFPFKEGLSTDSNLSSTVLEEILWCLGLEFSPFETKRKFLDSRLLARRNHIAHGVNLYVDPEEFDEMREILFELMSNIKSQIENTAIRKEYLAKVS